MPGVTGNAWDATHQYWLSCLKREVSSSLLGFKGLCRAARAASVVVVDDKHALAGRLLDTELWAKAPAKQIGPYLDWEKDAVKVNSQIHHSLQDFIRGWSPTCIVNLRLQS